MKVHTEGVTSTSKRNPLQATFITKFKLPVCRVNNALRKKSTTDLPTIQVSSTNTRIIRNWMDKGGRKKESIANTRNKALRKNFTGKEANKKSTKWTTILKS